MIMLFMSILQVYLETKMQYNKVQIIIFEVGKQNNSEY